MRSKRNGSSLIWDVEPPQPGTRDRHANIASAASLLVKSDCRRYRVRTTDDRVPPTLRQPIDYLVKAGRKERGRKLR